MLIRIHHETHYRYQAAPAAIVQRLMLTPCDFAGQRTLSWSIQAPGIEKAMSYVDGFGNRLHLITVRNTPEPHAIIAMGEVETTNMAGVVSGLPAHVPDAVFLRQTRATQPSKPMRALGQAVRQAGAALEQAHALMQEIHARIAYETGTSHAHTTAEEAFAEKRGVCQDHAHVMVGLARELGLPARYVTGYLVTGTGASSTAAHAWAELRIPDLGWVGFDPANGQSPTDQYVRLAAGLDAAAVAPVRGLRRGGGGAEEMTVAVKVEIAQQ